MKDDINEVSSTINSANHYYDCMRLIFTNLKQSLVSQIAKDSSINFASRSGSSDFEEEIKLLMSKIDLPSFIQDINDTLSKSQNPYYLIDIKAEENITESDMRTMADIAFEISINAKTHTVPVNIKATRGKTFDNLGSWESLGHSICVAKTKSKTKYLEKIKTLQGKYPDTPSDYFIWSFVKDDDSFKNMIESAQPYSYLTLNSESLQVNMSQLFHLQFNSSRAVKGLPNPTVPLSIVRKTFHENLAGKVTSSLTRLLELWK